MSKMNGFHRGVAVLALSGAMIGLGAQAASAATPGSSIPSTAATAADSSTAALSNTSLGMHLFNNSVDNLLLQSVSGDNAGVPTVGSTLTSGVGYQDFEVVYRAGKSSTTVTAVYQVQDTSGAVVGTATFKFSDNWIGQSDVTGTFTANGGSKLPLKTDSTPNGDYQVVDSTTATNTVAATTPQASALIQQYCNNTNNSAACTFTPTNHITTTQQKLLVSGYTQTGGDNEPSTISVSSGYDAQTATNTGSSVTATMKLGGVLSVGITQAYSQTLAYDHVFTSAQTLAVPAGDTGYIWGQVPVIQYTGTMKIVVDNTTWDITGMTVTSPDTSGVLTGFSQKSYPGYYSIGTPSQPPAIS